MLRNYILTCLAFLLVSFHPKSPENKYVRISNYPEMVLVKGGHFTMGSTKEQSIYSFSDEIPLVNVNLHDFYIGKYEITNAQFSDFLSEKGNQIQGGANWYKQDKYALIQRKSNSSFVPKSGFENYPVSNVTWYGASAYCQWLSQKTGLKFRLPTEAEWEYAARGGQLSKRYIYSGSNSPEEIAWSNEYASNSGTNWSIKNDKGIHAVGLKLPNELGLYDMSGNLSEWCSDLYHNKLKGGKNPKGPEYGSKRVLRGGSWDNKALSSRVSARNFSNPTHNFLVNKGFRIVREKDYSELKSSLKNYATDKDFNGTIIVAKQGEILFHESFGWADRKLNRPNTTNTTYAIASITKLFTSTIILQLVTEGKINLDSSINDYLKNFGNKEAGEKITIHHLLTHTSGLENCETKRGENEQIHDIYIDNASIDVIVNKYCSGAIVNEIGTVFDYNNGDFIILGKIIEEVTGKTFHEVLNEKILVPLDMKNTGLIQRDSDLMKLARSYKWDDNLKNYTKDINRRYQNYFASGAMYSTSQDLLNFSHALFNNELLNEHKLKLLLRTYPETADYGYGLWVNYFTYGKSVLQVAQRYGRIWGINTLISHLIEDDITIIVLANTNKVPVSEFQHIVGENLFD